MIALAFGSVLGSRAAIGSTVGLAVLAYLSQAVVSLSDRFSGWAALSPWYYYAANDPISNGLSAGYLVILVGLAAIAVVAAIALFERRDVSS